MTEEKKEVKEEARRATLENWGRVQILIYCITLVQNSFLKSPYFGQQNAYQGVVIL